MDVRMDVRMDEHAAEVHRTLLRLAGLLPDAALAEARTGLAASPAATAELIASAVVAAGIPLTHEDHGLLSRLVADPSALAGVPTGAGVAAPRFLFAPAPMSVLTSIGEQIAPSMDLTFGSDALLAGDIADAVDDAATEAAEKIPGLLGLWRAWRFAPDGEGGGSAARRVFLAEVEPATAPWSVAAALSAALVAAGETAPGVEVFTSEEPVPPYQAQARAFSALLWAADPGRPISLAAVYDTEDDGVGGFDAGHPTVDDEDERAALLDYLDSGIALAVTDGRIDDALDPDRRGCVPLSLRTDGEWIWTDTVHYYLEQHRLAPDPDLCAHIRERTAPPPDSLDGVALFRALVHLQRGQTGTSR